MGKSSQLFFEELLNLRRDLHRYPELSFKEFNTSKKIEQTVNSWGLTFKRFKYLETGGYCDVGSGERVILFRSDIDALPIEENEAHEIISQNKGVMHACGHDFHTAIGLGLLKYFRENLTELNGTLRVLFQPGEEAAPGGAEKVVEENIWENAKAILTTHVAPQYPAGKFILFNGPVQASSTSLLIQLTGPGGHTSQPAQTVDLIRVTGEYVSNLQSYLSQKIDPGETVAFAFGTIRSGSTHNIIPAHAMLRGTLRTLDKTVLNKCLDLIRQFSADYARLHGIEIQVDFPTNCPPTINDSGLFHRFQQYMKMSGRQDQLIKPGKPSMGADDFSFYLDKVPGLYLLTGGGGSGHLHSGDLELDENLLPVTIDVMAGFIAHLLKSEI